LNQRRIINIYIFTSSFILFTKLKNNKNRLNYSFIFFLLGLKIDVKKYDIKDIAAEINILGKSYLIAYKKWILANSNCFTVKYFSRKEIFLFNSLSNYKY